MVESSNKLIRVHPVQDESGDWFVIPYDLKVEFGSDNEDYEMYETGKFDIKWGKYRIGGCLSKAVLYAQK